MEKNKRIKIDKYKYGEVRYCDCMNKEYGLPSLEKDSFDLCLTDPPYGGNKQSKDGNIGKSRQYRVVINDRYNQDQHKEVLNVSKDQIIWGYQYYDFIPKTHSLIIWDKRCFNYYNGFSDGEIAWSSFNHQIRIFRYRWDGIVKEKPEERYHPFQKPYEVIKLIVEHFEPNSIIDPFLGSGTLGAVCEHLRIPWLGYEIDDYFRPIINKRLKNIHRKKIPKRLF